MEDDLVKRVFRAVWQTVARDMPMQDYSDANREFAASGVMKNLATVHGARLIGAEEAAGLGDNSADYETVTYNYSGLDEVRALVASKRPVALVGWHHGARQHSDYGIARVLPETAIFTRRTFQYGKVFSFPMLKAPALGLARMNGFLRDGRPVFHYLDGVPLGRTVQLQMLGVTANLATAPLSIIRSVEGVRIIPVTNYYRGGNIVDYIFHHDWPGFERAGEMSEVDLLAALLEFLEQDLRRRGPEQVLVEFLLHRERLAREMKP